MFSLHNQKVSHVRILFIYYLQEKDSNQFQIIGYIRLGESLKFRKPLEVVTGKQPCKSDILFKEKN